MSSERKPKLFEKKIFDAINTVFGVNTAEYRLSNDKDYESHFYFYYNNHMQFINIDFMGKQIFQIVWHSCHNEHQMYTKTIRNDKNLTGKQIFDKVNNLLPEIKIHLLEQQNEIISEYQ